MAAAVAGSKVRARVAGWAAFVAVCLAAGALAWAAAAPGGLAPAPALRLAALPGNYRLGPCLEVLEDPDGALGVDQVSRAPLAEGFRPLGHEVLNLGLSRSAFWLRFTLESPPDAPTSGPHAFWVLDFGRAFFHSLTLYAPAPGGGWQRDESADPRVPLPAGAGSSLRSLHLPAPDPGRQATYYVRVQSQMALILPLSVQSARAYLEQTKRHALALGAYCGVVLAMAAYNFFLFITLRDKSYLWYVCHVLCYGLYFTGLNGLIMAYAPPLVATRGIGLLFFSVLAALCFTTIFARSFLALRANHANLDRALLAMAVVTGALALASPWLGIRALNHTMTILGMVLPVLVLGTGFVSWRGGYRPARYFLIAWGVYGLGAILYALTYRGILPFSDWGFHGLQIASVIETVLLSLALADRIRTLSTSHQRLERKATTDALSGLYNASFFRERLGEEMAVAGRTGRSLSLVLMDIDDFKRYNDTYGHLEGDRVLAALGEVIRRSLREDDLGCRYGGEEFAIILPGASRAQASSVAERVRTHFGSLIFTPSDEASARVSVCAGVAQARSGEPAEDLVKRADRALYQAKAAGKDRTIAAD